MTARPGATRNLLVVRAGDRSLHPHWALAPEGPGTGGPEFDLAVLYYGEELGKWRGTGRMYSHSPGGSKFPSLADWLDANWDVVSTYDFIGFPDDDIAADASSWNRLFQALADHNLDLAQPALSDASHWSHPITLRDKGSRCRYTNFVEVMMPFFSLRALGTCLPTFRLSPSGWGIDWLWPKLLRPQGMVMGIVDEIAVDHTRAVSSTSATSNGDETAIRNFLPHPPPMDLALVAEIFALATPDPMVCSAVPRPPAAGEMRPVTFVACLAGLNEDCETTLATIAKALHGTGDDVLLVATPNVPISPATKALGDLAPVKLAYVPWGTDLAAQYHAALAAASHEDVVVISPGCELGRTALDELRTLAGQGPADVVAAKVGSGLGGNGPVVLVGRRAELCAAGGFASAKSSFSNANGTVGSVGARQLMERVARQAAGAGRRVATVVLGHGTGPLAPDLAPPTVDATPATGAPVHVTSGDPPAPPVLPDGAPDRRRASMNCSAVHHAALAPEGRELAAFVCPFVPASQAGQLEAWFAPPAIAPVGADRPWAGTARHITASGHLNFAAAFLVHADLGTLTETADIEAAVEILRAAGASAEMVASKLPNAPRALAAP